MRAARRLLVPALSLVLTVGTAGDVFASSPSPSPSVLKLKLLGADAPPVLPQVDVAGQPTASDGPAAAVRAKQTGGPVEVLPARTATSSTFVDGRGSTTVRTFTAPVHVRRGA